MRLQADRERAALRRHAQLALSTRSPRKRSADAAATGRRGRSVLGAGLLGAAVLVVLGGCGLTDDPLPCPGVGILDQARLLTLYRDGTGRDPSDVAFEVELRNVSGRCDHDIDEEEGGGVEVTFDLSIRATRGPAAGTDRLSIPFFVALTDANRQIVAKEVFGAEIAFAATDMRARTVEMIEQWIPLGPGESGAAYETLVGIQLTPAQLEDARRRKAQ